MTGDLLVFNGKISPAVQLRTLLVRARGDGLDFSAAWVWALGQPPEFSDGKVKWPHDTQHRREWKAILLSSRPTWERAYDGLPPTAKERKLRLLIAA